VTLVLFFLALCLGYLWVEAVRLERWQERIPLRVMVTGTRGKTSVARLLASVLREDGWRVLAKTTGSEAALVLPDGRERSIRRRGQPSILEQIAVVGLGARMKVDALVVESMAVHAENLRVEGRRLLRPHLVLVTNLRVDHVEAQGDSRETVGKVIGSGVPKGARVLIPIAEWGEGLAMAAKEAGGSLLKVEGSEGERAEVDQLFGANIDLVRAASELLGVGDEVVDRGIETARGDVGLLRAWSYPRTGGTESWRVVNAFAANDPESTFLALDQVTGGGRISEKPIGLLNLRADRGDRTLLWVEALKDGGAARFSHLYLSGLHARAMVRRLEGPDGPSVEVLPRMEAPKVMAMLTKRSEAGVLFGFGNIGGLGEEMVRHWAEAGYPVGLPLEGETDGRAKHPTGVEDLDGP
jgi:poly-gamma-glutamate synthase PgsB/CapB